MTSVFLLPKDGKILSLPGFITARSLNEVQRQLPDGVYTTFRTYGQSGAVRLQDHFLRLEESAELLGKPIRLEQTLLRRVIADLLYQKKFPESRLRLCVDLQKHPGDLYIMVEQLTIPAIEEYQNGVKVASRHLHRENPKAKSTQFVQTAESIKAEMDRGIHEILMVGEDGRILEGLSSNFYAIRDGSVWTADEGVLAGVTRGLVLEVLGRLQIACVFRGLPTGDLGKIEEAFITSSSRGVLPVSFVDNQMIGKGKPGEMTNQIRQKLNQRIDELVEPIDPAG